MRVAGPAGMPRAESWMPIALLLLIASSPACECDCESEIEIGLPTLDASASQSLLVQFRRGQATDAQIVCAWDTTTAGSTGAWSCTPAARDVRVDVGTPYFSHFTYQSSDVTSAWSIELQGPTGSQALMRTPRSTDPGEGYPGSCICYPYDIMITADELRAVGAVLP